MAGDVIGKGVIELVADARTMRAGIEEAKKSIKELGSAQAGTSTAAAQSIENYIGKLKQQAATVSMTARETELYKLALRGASTEQIRAADSALKLVEAHDKAYAAGQLIGSALKYIAVAAVAAGTAIAYAANSLINSAGNYQDLAEKVGDTGQALSTLAVSASVGGVSMDQVGAAAIKLSKNLVGVDDDSKAAGAAVKALGLNLETLKAASATERIYMIAKAMNGFAESTVKGDLAVALFNKDGANLLPFLKELGDGLQRNAGLTSEQIRLADDYSDAQKRMTAELTLLGQRLVINVIGPFTDFKNALIDTAKEIFGVQKSATALANDDAIKRFADSALTHFASVIDFAQRVVQAFRMVGTGLAGTVAAREALMKGNVLGSFEVMAQMEKDLTALAKFTSVADALKTRIANRYNSGPNETGRDMDKDRTPIDNRPRLPAFSVAEAPGRAAAGGRDNSARLAEQEAKAQLAFDLDMIRKSGDAQLAEFTRQDRLLSARHAAQLLDDQDFYDEKRHLTEANSRTEAATLNESIKRLERERFTGDNAAKESIDRDRKVADEKSKLARVQADAANALDIISIQQAAANKLVARSLSDLRSASDDYIESVQRRNAAEQAGVGRGDLAREVTAGRNAIEEKFIDEQKKRQRDRDNANTAQARDTYDKWLAIATSTYEKEVIEYDKAVAAKRASESNWLNGANDAMANYIANARNVAKQTEDAWTNAFTKLEDALVQFVKTGKLDFKSLADSIITELIRIQIKAAAVKLSESSSSGGGWLAAVGKIFGAAIGGGGGGGLEGTGESIGISMEGVGNMGDSAAPVGAFAQGTPWVPRTGLALVHEGERIISAKENRGGGAGGPTFIVDNRGASAEAVQRLEKFVRSVNGSIEQRVLGMMRQSKVRGMA
jgi:lambda family phage tail tape measure protein